MDNPTGKANWSLLNQTRMVHIADMADRVADAVDTGFTAFIIRQLSAGSAEPA